MPDSKFIVLQGDLAHNDPGDYFASIFDKYGIETIYQKIAYLNDKEKWGTPDIFVLDYRHFLYDDDAFRDYVSSVKDNRPVIRVADLPFHYEALGDRQEHIDDLIRRTKIVHEILGDEGLLISPSIGSFSEEIAKLYLQYFRECGKLFHKYAVDCSVEGTDRDIAVLVGLLNSILSKCPRDIVVTKWCIPSFDQNVRQMQLGDDDLIVQKTKVAAQRMRNIYRTINAMSPNATWLIAGAGKDFYSPKEKPDKFVWNWPYASKKTWSQHNFMGLLSWDGHPKFHLAQALSEIFDGRVQ